MARSLMELALRHYGQEVERVRANLDVDRGDELLPNLVAATNQANISERDIDQCALDVYQLGHRDPEFTFTAIDTRVP